MKEINKNIKNTSCSERQKQYSIVMQRYVNNSTAAYKHLLLKHRKITIRLEVTASSSNAV